MFAKDRKEYKFERKKYLSYSYLFFLLAIAHIFLSSKLVLAAKVLILKQDDDMLYNKVADSVKSYIESIEDMGKLEIVIENSQSNVEVAKEKIENMRIKSKGFALVALGIIPTYAAFESVGWKKQNPVIFSLVFSPERLGNLPDNFAYFSMMPDPKYILSEFKKRFGSEEIVVPFSRDNIGAVLSIKRAAKDLDIKIKDVLVSNESEVRRTIGSGKPFWLIPDSTVVNSDTLSDIYQAAQKVPAIAFSEVFAKLGIELSYQIDFEELGKEIGKVIIEILKGKIDTRHKKVFYPPVRLIEKKTKAEE
jgi:ABC-type uncharacterized transport system substrate-binding protein